MQTFTHLHTHTEYSLLDGMCRIPALVHRAKELGMDSLAITDHGSMYGAVDFYLAAKEAGIKPIIGCEVYVAPASPERRGTGEKNHFHLVLLAKDRNGYHNLLQLVTKAHLEGFYYKPRVTKETLQKHQEGLIALSACTQGEVARFLGQGNEEGAAAAAGWYRDTFEQFYLELQDHAIPELSAINKGLVALSQRLNIPLVATNDVHYIHREDSQAHDLLLCIQTNTSIHDPKRLKLADDSFYLKSPQEMAELFSWAPEAVENTQRIAQSCDLSLELGELRLPHFQTPAGETADDFLRELCYQGLQSRFPHVADEVRQRLEYELQVIRQTRFADYFLVVWDFVSFARGRGIPCGVRGSAAASLVLYCLGVTDIDPLKYKLVFERFLNVERKEMPDIDMDFADDRRGEVIAYVAEKYGADRVAQIITFGTLGARAALRDVGRALGMPYSDVDRVARLIPPAINITLERALEENGEFHQAYQEDQGVQNLVDTARKLEGVARHASTHAAGVVISREPLTNYVPLQRPTGGDEQGIATTQYAMDPIAKIGLLKMDFLGLSNLTILARARETIAQVRGEDIDLQRIPLDDAKTFHLLASGETTGVFQLEGAGMRRCIRELKPSAFSDLAALVALYRPGPMQHIPTFIRAKEGKEPPRYPHPALKEILEDTYGVIVYQDQVLRIVQVFAGYSLGRADVVRKAMGKKIPEVMREERRHFVAGAREQGFSAEVANQVFDLIEPFAGYAFNKAHAVSYAMLAYQTAYLKANYPAEYMSAALTVHAGQADKVATAIAECHRLGIPVLPPDVNQSQHSFTIQEKDGRSAIRFGLSAIKNVGSGPVETMVAARNTGGLFASLEDFCRRVDLRGINKRALESLIKVGTFDSLAPRGPLLNSLDRLLALAQREQRLKASGQATMFDLWGETVPVPLPSLALSSEDVTVSQRLAWEKELLGVYLSDHPFSRAAVDLASSTTALCGQIDADMAGQRVVVAGIVSRPRTMYTKEGRPFLSTVLEDLDGSLEVMVWSDVYEVTRELWEEGNILLVEGKVRVKDDRVQLNCFGARRFQPETERISPAAVALEERVAPEPPVPSVPERRLLINLRPTSDADGDVARLRELVALLKAYPGEHRVHLAVDDGSVKIRLEMPQINTNFCPELQRQLAELVGKEALKIE